MRAGKSTAPSGPLVVKARDGDRDYFPAGPVAGRAGLVTGLRAPERPPRAEDEEDAEAGAAVAALEAGPPGRPSWPHSTPPCGRPRA